MQAVQVLPQPVRREISSKDCPAARMARATSAKLTSAHSHLSMAGGAGDVARG